VVVGFGLIVLVGIGLFTAIVQGAFDPPYAPDLLLARVDVDSLPQVRELDGARLYALALPDQPPLTLTMFARNDGASDSGWGLWLTLALPDETTQDVLMIVTQDREVSTPIRAPEQDGLWLREFTHIDAAENLLYVDLRADGALTLRINNEVVDGGHFPGATITGGGVALYREADMRWTYLRVFGQAVGT